ncbi:hypothetical protein KFU94_19320 [Chloroflexi bacterium TSY]|nr:hypothetical protein [Chloroflexi bacterium TSY]
MGEVFIWDTATNELVDVIKSHSDTVNRIVFHNNYLASGGQDGQIILRDLAMHDTFVKRLDGHESQVNMVAFRPSSKLLASASGDEIHIWDVEEVQAKHRLSSEDGAEFLSVAFSPDGLSLAAGDDRGNLRRWETDSWTPLEPLLLIHEAGITDLAYHPREPLLASGSFNQSIIFWDTSSHVVELSRKVLTVSKRESQSVSTRVVRPIQKIKYTREGVVHFSWIDRFTLLETERTFIFSDFAGSQRENGLI